jgi:hypothetical protein
MTVQGKGSRAKSKANTKVKGRTIYLDDDLFERIIVQAHRRGETISEYVSALLGREVPDHRVAKETPGAPGAA